MTARLIRDRVASRGQGLVEFALVIPIFLLLLFGLIDAGRLVYQHSVLSQAAREGARLASVEASWVGSGDASCGTGGGPVCPSNVGALRTDIRAAANRMVTPFAVITNAQLYTSCDPTGGAPTGDWNDTTCTSNTSGNVASVRVESTFLPITPIVSTIVGSVTMSASTSMVIN
jgi:Flp pilus assembly protein TadG